MDTEPLRQLYRAYQNELYLYLYSLCHNRELAQDLMQETFLKAILSLPNDHANVRAWLYLVARNLYLNYRNKEKRKEVDADIEKQDVISEYLFEEGTVPGLGEVTISEDLKPSLGETSDTDSEHAFIKTIQQTIRRAFVKMGVIVGAVLLAILLFVIFALPHVVSLFYYDPGKIVASDSWSDTNQMTLDMAVYTELFIPGYQREKVTVTDRDSGVCTKKASGALR